MWKIGLALRNFLCDINVVTLNLSRHECSFFVLVGKNLLCFNCVIIRIKINWNNFIFWNFDDVSIWDHLRIWREDNQCVLGLGWKRKQKKLELRVFTFLWTTIFWLIRHNCFFFLILYLFVRLTYLVFWHLINNSNFPAA